MALKITVNITDEQQACLEHDLLDIEEWVQSAVLGKINSCKKRMLKEAQEKLLADPNVSSLPATESGFVETYKARPYYKNRKQRDAEAAER